MDKQTIHHVFKCEHQFLESKVIQFQVILHQIWVEPLNKDVYKMVKNVLIQHCL
jgi:hypothetical protein